LFNYLAIHPEVCPASFKETRFFLDRDYPVVVKRVFDDTLDAYDALFGDCNEGLRLEATPDYLYSPGTPDRIKETLPNVNFVFVLRNPIDRLFSWYRFAREIGQLNDGTSFDVYVERQLLADSQAHAAQHMLALEQGRYSLYLSRYFARFGDESITVQLFEDLASSPRRTLQNICNFAGLNGGYYNDFEFAVHNKTRDMRLPAVNRLYRTVKSTIRKRTHGTPWAHRHLRRISQTLEPLYSRVNARPNSSIRMSPDTCKLLNQFYEPENGALQKLLNLQQVPWPELTSTSTTERNLAP
jgi:hypothetical protein